MLDTTWHERFARSLGRQNGQMLVWCFFPCAQTWDCERERRCTRQPDGFSGFCRSTAGWADRLIPTSCSSRHPCPFCSTLPLLSILSLWTVSFSSQHSSSGPPCLHHHTAGAAGLNPESSTNQHFPARLWWLVLALYATLLGLPCCFWAGIWLIFLKKHGRPGNSFWQLVSCLWSVHLCHR